MSKTVGMFFTKTNDSTLEPDVFVSGEKLQVVKEFKYLGILIDTSTSPQKKVCKWIKLNLATFRFLRNYMSTKAAKMYMHSMIFSVT